MKAGRATCWGAMAAALTLAALPLRGQDYRQFGDDGIGKLQVGDFAGAEADFSRALELQPSLPGLYSLRGMARQRLGNFIGARADFDAALQLSPDDPGARSKRAELRLRDGDLMGALTDLDLAIKAKPDLHDLWLQRGLVRRRMKDYTGALADETRAIELAPDFPGAYFERAMTRRENGLYAEARVDISKALDLAPAPAAFTLRGEIEQRLGDYDAALADFNAAVERNPKYLPAYRHRAILHYERAQWSEALADSRRTIEVAVRPTDAMYARIMVWIVRNRMGQGVEAAAEIETWLRTLRGPDSTGWPAKLVRFYADRLDEAGLFAAAAVGTAKVVQEQQCEAWYHAGVKRLVAGDAARAKEYFEKCRALGVTNFVEHNLAAIELAALKKKASETNAER